MFVCMYVHVRRERFRSSKLCIPAEAGFVKSYLVGHLLHVRTLQQVPFETRTVKSPPIENLRPSPPNNKQTTPMNVPFT